MRIISNKLKDYVLNYSRCFLNSSGSHRPLSQELIVTKLKNKNLLDWKVENECLKIKTLKRCFISEFKCVISRA